jgi:hypothetical protein
MPITIHADPPLAPKSEMCLDVVRQALRDARPAGEDWIVMIFGVDQEVTHFDFRRGAEPAKSLALVLQDGDAGRALVYAGVCRLLRREWPGALATH